MVNKIDLIPDKEFIELVNNSATVSEVLSSLGYTTKGNSWSYQIVKERMEKLKLSFGKTKEWSSSIPLDKILTKDSGYSRTKLKERLFREGLKEKKCEICGISDWQGKPISLQLHHKNGINNDNRLSNLQILCPNCHSQTDNFGTRGKGLSIKKKCDNLPQEDIDIIMNAVHELGIVQARKQLNYRNSLINSVVKYRREKVIMVNQDGTEKIFNTSYDAAKYLLEILHKGSSIESNRSGISKCCSGKQKMCQGYKFKRSVVE